MKKNPYPYNKEDKVSFITFVAWALNALSVYLLITNTIWIFYRIVNILLDGGTFEIRHIVGHFALYIIAGIILIGYFGLINVSKRWSYEDTVKQSINGRKLLNK